jgi:hypothetical protein
MSRADRRAWIDNAIEITRVRAAIAGMRISFSSLGFAVRK